jgi:tetratricopeptide (TPR) repeat protein
VLAQCHLDKGKPRSAIPLFEACLEAKRRLRGQMHISTLNSMFDLAECYKEDKQFQRALELYEECLEGRQSLLGSEHKDTVDCTKGVASMNKRLKRQGK